MSPFPDDSFSELNNECGLSTPTQVTERGGDVMEDLDDMIGQLAPARGLDMVPTSDLKIGTPEPCTSKVCQNIKFASKHKFTTQLIYIFCISLTIISGFKEEKRILAEKNLKFAFIALLYLVARPFFICSSIHQLVRLVISIFMNCSVQDEEDFLSRSYRSGVLPLVPFYCEYLYVPSCHKLLSKRYFG